MSITYVIACRRHNKCITLGNYTAAGFFTGFSSKEPRNKLDSRIGDFLYKHCDDDLLLLDEHKAVGYTDDDPGEED